MIQGQLFVKSTCSNAYNCQKNPLPVSKALPDMFLYQSTKMAKILQKMPKVAHFSVLHLVRLQKQKMDNFGNFLAMLVLSDVDFIQQTFTCDFGVFQQFLVIFGKYNLVTCQFVTIGQTRPLMSDMHPPSIFSPRSRVIFFKKSLNHEVEWVCCFWFHIWFHFGFKLRRALSLPQNAPLLPILYKLIYRPDLVQFGSSENNNGYVLICKKVYYLPRIHKFIMPNNEMLAIAL